MRNGASKAAGRRCFQSSCVTFLVDSESNAIVRNKCGVAVCFHKSASVCSSCAIGTEVFSTIAFWPSRRIRSASDSASAFAPRINAAPCSSGLSGISGMPARRGAGTTRRANRWVSCDTAERTGTSSCSVRATDFTGASTTSNVAGCKRSRTTAAANCTDDSATPAPTAMPEMCAASTELQSRLTNCATG